MSKLVFGFGINDADYVVKPTIDGKRIYCHFYVTWYNMIQRCYSEKFQQSHPTYVGCSVCPEWKSFMAFRSWMEKQDYEGKQLDKDLLSPGNKVYSPETCCFVEQWLNSLFNDHAARRGKWPIGVYWHKQRQKFVAQLNVDGKRKHLGYFDNSTDALTAYQKAKKECIEGLMENYPDERVKQAILQHRCTSS